METLSEALASVLRTPCPAESPLQAVTRAEVVVVHSQGMARWLEMELARRLKISSNIHFPFPKSTIREAMSTLLGEETETWKVWQPEAMLWSTLDALESVLDTPPFAPLATYLSKRSGGSAQDALGSADGVLLARQIADVIDRYITYRPDVLLEWSNHPPSDDWQAVLSNLVSSRIGSHHLAMKASALRAKVAHLRASGERPPVDLPPRICLFGISTLPPFFLDLFQSLDHICDLHLFVLCPSNVYWADIRSKREIARALRQREREGKETSTTTLHLEEGNPLLASFGRLGRDFQVVLEGSELQAGYEDVEAFDDPAENSSAMLHVLQSDILNLRHRGQGEDERSAPQLTMDKKDTSIRVHACYGAMRQVEALRDEIITRLEADPSLEPRDIVVMTPDIERFAPLIEAVFGDLGSTPKIPVRIADRPVGKENPVAEILARIMAMTDARLTGPEVLDLLSLEPIQRNFKLLEIDLALLETWVKESGIRWGIDAEDRERVGQPGANGANTWRFGLNRMLLGIAMPGGDTETFMGVLPYDEIEGGDALGAGRLADACEALFGVITLLRDRRRRSPQAWVGILKTLVTDLVSLPDNDAWRIQQVHELLDDISNEADLAKCSRAITFQAMRALVTSRLNHSQRASGFVTGAVTFCAMVPMRSVPFKVVVLMGMDEDAFPRKQRRVDFDLTTQRPRLGDRNPREEDRYLILEALLAARDAMVIIYSGHDSQTGALTPPAAPVDELLDVLEESFEGARKGIVQRHPLHAFSPTLFGVSVAADTLGQAIEPRSHDTRLVSAAKSMLANTSAPPVRFRGQLTSPGPLKEVSIADLTSFFEHTAKCFLNKRLGLYLPKSDEGLDPREPLNAGNDLNKWGLRQAALMHRLAAHDASTEELYRRSALSGGLPLGDAGRIDHDMLMQAIPNIVDTGEMLSERGALTHIDVDMPLDGTRLVGRINNIRGQGGPRVVMSVSTKGHKYNLRLWLYHVIRRAFERDSEPTRSFLVCRGTKSGVERTTLGLTMSSDAARDYLAMLIDYFRMGQQAPLLFFPSTSFVYANAMLKASLPKTIDKSDSEAVMACRLAMGLKRAAEAWDPKRSPERDEHHLMLWGTQRPFEDEFTLPNVEPALSPSFAELALSVWSPFLDEKERNT